MATNVTLNRRAEEINVTIDSEESVDSFAFSLEEASQLRDDLDFFIRNLELWQAKQKREASNVVSLEAYRIEKFNREALKADRNGS